MIKKIITKTRIKIVLVVLVTFLVVKGFSSTVFLADTPVISPDFIARLKNTPSELASLPGRLLAGLNSLNLFKKQPTTPASDMFADVKIVTPPENIVFTPIRKGVYAANDPATGQKYIKIEAGTKYRIVGTVTINGKEYPQIEFVE